MSEAPDEMHVEEPVVGYVEEAPAAEPTQRVVPDNMHFEMLVASVHLTSMSADVTLSNGDMTKATVPVVEVTLSDESGKHGSRTMRFVTAAERAYAEAKYHAGEMISVEI